MRPRSFFSFFSLSKCPELLQMAMGGTGDRIEPFYFLFFFLFFDKTRRDETDVDVVVRLIDRWMDGWMGVVVRVICYTPRT